MSSSKVPNLYICGKVATIRKESYILAMQNSLSEILFIPQAEKKQTNSFLVPGVISSKLLVRTINQKNEIDLF